MPSLDWLLKRHKRDLRLLEDLRKRPSFPARDPGFRGENTPVSSREKRPCKGCGSTEDHRDPVIKRRHLFVLAQRHLARKSWAGLTPEQRRQRLAPAHAARRKVKDEVVITSVHPRLIKLLGRAAILRQAGR